jgi:hypothetical protein
MWYSGRVNEQTVDVCAVSAAKVTNPETVGSQLELGVNARNETVSYDNSISWRRPEDERSLQVLDMLAGRIGPPKRRRGTRAFGR